MAASRMHRIALLEAPSGTGRHRNIVCVADDGSVVWRAELPPGSQPDAYVAVSVGDTEISASSWSGYRVVLDAETGRILRSDFVK